MVIRGCCQTEGIDFTETYSPVARFESIRLILAISITNGFYTCQFDVATAFLYAKLDEEIYMKQPEGYQSQVFPHHACHLLKTLYGLKQAPLGWYKEFGSFLESNGLLPCQSDKCIYTNSSKTIILCLYVDDAIACSKFESDLIELINNIRSKYKIEYSGLNNYLGIQIASCNDGILLHQKMFTESFIKEVNMEN